jgi:putative ABC transport system substrate-binding protein
MRRREFIAGVGAITAWPAAVRAQQPTSRIPRIGIIDDDRLLWDHFRKGLRDLGYVEGQSIAIEYRSAEDNLDRLRRAALELALLPVDVIVVYGSTATRAALQATSTIPIVMIGVGDPVRAPFVMNLARTSQSK